MDKVTPTQADIQAAKRAADDLELESWAVEAGYFASRFVQAFARHAEQARREANKEHFRTLTSAVIAMGGKIVVRPCDMQSVLDYETHKHTDPETGNVIISAIRGQTAALEGQ